LNEPLINFSMNIKTMTYVERPILKSAARQQHQRPEESATQTGTFFSLQKPGGKNLRSKQVFGKCVSSHRVANCGDDGNRIASPVLDPNMRLETKNTSSSCFKTTLIP